MDMCTDTCTAMHADTCVDMHIDVRVDMSMDISMRSFMRRSVGKTCARVCVYTCLHVRMDLCIEVRVQTCAYTCAGVMAWALGLRHDLHGQGVGHGMPCVAGPPAGVLTPKLCIDARADRRSHVHSHAGMGSFGPLGEAGHSMLSPTSSEPQSSVGDVRWRAHKRRRPVHCSGEGGHVPAVAGHTLLRCACMLSTALREFQHACTAHGEHGDRI